MPSSGNHIFRGPSGKLGVQLFRYLVSGGIAFLADTSLLALLTEHFGEQRLLLWTAISFCVGLVVTYLFSIKWVFDVRRVRNRFIEILIFTTIGILGLGLTELCMWLFAKQLGLYYLLAKAITTVLVFCWNFIAKKMLLFRHQK